MEPFDFSTKDIFFKHFTHQNSLKIFTNVPSSFYESIENLKLAMFDLDDTIITSNVKSSLSRTHNDWVFKYPEVPNVLKSLQNNGYTLVIITNQLGISKGFIDSTEFTKKILILFDKCNINAFVLVATDDDEFRKPAIGSFEYFFDFLSEKKQTSDFSPLLKKRSKINSIDFYPSTSDLHIISHPQFKKVTNEQKCVFNSSSISKFYRKADSKIPFGLGRNISNLSFYCGDAAGRFHKDQDDFSNSDILFAININVNFILPEQIFLNQVIVNTDDFPVFELGRFISYEQDFFKNKILNNGFSKSGKSNLLVLMMGPPGCGKSYFAKKHFSEYFIISYVS